MKLEKLKKRAAQAVLNKLDKVYERWEKKLSRCMAKSRKKTGKG